MGMLVVEPSLAGEAHTRIPFSGSIQMRDLGPGVGGSAAAVASASEGTLGFS